MNNYSPYIENGYHSFVIDRATALHKMMRLMTAAAGGNAYLTFMGNEFGHPEWIDFPRVENGNSYQYCRRQWSLLGNGNLKYQYLNDFDHDMIATLKHYHVLDQDKPDLMKIHEDDQVIAFERGSLLFAFNFNPTQEFYDYAAPVTQGLDYEVLFTSDDFRYGGFGRIARARHSAFTPGYPGNAVRLHLPPRTCMVLCPRG